MRLAIPFSGEICCLIGVIYSWEKNIKDNIFVTQYPPCTVVGDLLELNPHRLFPPAKVVVHRSIEVEVCLNICIKAGK